MFWLAAVLMETFHIGMFLQVMIEYRLNLKRKGKHLHRMAETDNQILCLDYNADGSNFATAGKDRKVF